MAMTLKSLAGYLRESSENMELCDYYKNEWVVSHHKEFSFEPLDESDIIGLRPYLQCYLLSFYEYLAIQDGVLLPDWFASYKSAYCPMKENDIYIGLVELYDTLYLGDFPIDKVVKSFEHMISISIEPFKSRGIPRTVLDDSV